METIGKGAQSARATWELTQVDGSQDALGFSTSADGLWQTGRFYSPQLMAELAPKHSESWRGLTVSGRRFQVPAQLLSQAGNQRTCRYVGLAKRLTPRPARNANSPSWFRTSRWSMWKTTLAIWK